MKSIYFTHFIPTSKSDPILVNRLFLSQSSNTTNLLTLLIKTSVFDYLRKVNDSLSVREAKIRLQVNNDDGWNIIVTLYISETYIVRSTNVLVFACNCNQTTTIKLVAVIVAFKTVPKHFNRNTCNFIPYATQK